LNIPATSPNPRVSSVRPPREARPAQTQIARQRGVHASLGAAIRNQCENRRLSAQERLRECVARHCHVHVDVGIDGGVQVAGKVRRDVAAVDLARERDIASGVHRCMIVDVGVGEAGHQGSGREAPEESGHPEAYAAFIGTRSRCRDHHDSACKCTDESSLQG